MDPTWPAAAGAVGAVGGRPVTLFLALVLDALLGEPKWLWSRMPHPAVLMGTTTSVPVPRARNAKTPTSPERVRVILMCFSFIYELV